MAGDGAAGLGEAGLDDHVALLQLLIAQGTEGLHRIFIVGAGLGAVVGIFVFVEGAMCGAAERHPVGLAHDAP